LNLEHEPLLLDGVDDLDDVDADPTRMERLYPRDDEDRSWSAISAVRCPTCGRTIRWRNRRRRPICEHNAAQTSFSSYSRHQW
jgi:hypothetical protein